VVLVAIAWVKPSGPAPAPPLEPNSGVRFRRSQPGFIDKLIPRRWRKPVTEYAWPEPGIMPIDAETVVAGLTRHDRTYMWHVEVRDLTTDRVVKPSTPVGKPILVARGSPPRQERLTTRLEMPPGLYKVVVTLIVESANPDDGGDNDEAPAAWGSGYAAAVK
jgi:hypothetical protein